MKALVLTVGTGDSRDPERTLFEPLRRSLADGDWSHVTLVPSEVSRSLAEQFRDRERESNPQLPIRMQPLPAGAEEDPDHAYEHFDRVLFDLLRSVEPSGITIDFTRGTKAMSAAIVLAAARHGIHELRYIAGAQRDDRGQVVAGKERVLTVQAYRVEHDRRVDLARQVFAKGNFEAAVDVLATPEAKVEPIRQAARYYAAWDRLDYRSAARILGSGGLRPAPEGWEDLWPTPRMTRWTEALAPHATATETQETPSEPRALCKLIADLIANGERRIAHGQFEDALVRAYRVLELIGQARLSEWGLDTARMDESHCAVRRLKDKIARKKQVPLSRHPRPALRQPIPGRPPAQDP